MNGMKVLVFQFDFEENSDGQIPHFATCDCHSLCGIYRYLHLIEQSLKQCSLFSILLSFLTLSRHLPLARSHYRLQSISLNAILKLVPFGFFDFEISWNFVNAKQNQ